MLIEALGTALLFFGSILGVAWPLAVRLALDLPEKIVVTATLSLLGIWLLAWAIYVFALPTAFLWTIPAVALLHLGLCRRSLAAAVRDPEVRSLFGGQIIVTSWCLGWLALIVSYSGGDWLGDWFGHWDRTRFFLERGPHDILFTGFDPLPSRPPLANVITGAFVWFTRVDFAHYQLVMTLLNSLAFLPAALLARRFGGRQITALLAVFVMVNPLFVQNATYAWTKLQVVFFVLTALYFFLRAHDADKPRHAGVLCAASLGAGMIAHYSAGPYVVVLVIAWLARGWSRRRDSRWWKSTALAGLVGAAVLATWFSWSFAVFGLGGTFLSNSSITDQAPSLAEQASRIALNLRDTLVPHFVRDVDWTLFAQRSAWGHWRDWLFFLYQRNLGFALGSVAWLVVLFALRRQWHRASFDSRLFWTGFLLGTLTLGVASHAGRDPWGNTHICEQPLIVLGLALFASHWQHLGTAWRRIVITGAALDFLLGIVLHFGVQSYLIDRWFTPARTAGDYSTSYTGFALLNLREISRLNLQFLGETLQTHPALVLTLLGGLLVLAINRARRHSLDPACTPGDATGAPQPAASSGPPRA